MGAVRTREGGLRRVEDLEGTRGAIRTRGGGGL